MSPRTHQHELETRQREVQARIEEIEKAQAGRDRTLRHSLQRIAALSEQIQILDAAGDGFYMFRGEQIEENERRALRLDKEREQRKLRKVQSGWESNPLVLTPEEQRIASRMNRARHIPAPPARAAKPPTAAAIEAKYRGQVFEGLDQLVAEDEDATLHLQRILYLHSGAIPPKSAPSAPKRHEPTPTPASSEPASNPPSSPPNEAPASGSNTATSSREGRPLGQGVVVPPPIRLPGQPARNPPAPHPPPPPPAESPTPSGPPPKVTMCEITPEGCTLVWTPASHRVPGKPKLLAYRIIIAETDKGDKGRYAFMNVPSPTHKFILNGLEPLRRYKLVVIPIYLSRKKANPQRMTTKQLAAPQKRKVFAGRPYGALHLQTAPGDGQSRPQSVMTAASPELKFEGLFQLLDTDTEQGNIEELLVLANVGDQREKKARGEWPEASEGLRQPEFTTRVNTEPPQPPPEPRAPGVGVPYRGALRLPPPKPKGPPGHTAPRPPNTHRPAATAPAAPRLKHPVTARGQAASPPRPDGKVIVSSISARSCRISWTKCNRLAPISHSPTRKAKYTSEAPTGYRVVIRSADGNEAEGVAEVGPTETDYLIKGLTADSRYRATVIPLFGEDSGTATSPTTSVTGAPRYPNLHFKTHFAPRLPSAEGQHRFEIKGSGAAPSEKHSLVFRPVRKIKEGAILPPLLSWAKERTEADKVLEWGTNRRLRRIQRREQGGESTDESGSEEEEEEDNGGFAPQPISPPMADPEPPRAPIAGRPVKNVGNLPPIPTSR